MHLIAIAWMYVVLMAAVVEAMSPNGTVLGAVFTVLLWGLLPLSVVMYLLRTRARREARRAAQRHADQAAGIDVDSAPLDPDERRHAAGELVAPVRKEP